MEKDIENFAYKTMEELSIVDNSDLTGFSIDELKVLINQLNGKELKVDKILDDLYTNPLENAGLITIVENIKDIINGIYNKMPPIPEENKKEEITNYDQANYNIKAETDYKNEIIEVNEISENNENNIEDIEEIQPINLDELFVQPDEKTIEEAKDMIEKRKGIKDLSKVITNCEATKQRLLNRIRPYEENVKIEKIQYNQIEDERV